MKIAIWERYFLRQFLKMFILFLSCFYGLYVIIDYASHTSALSHHHIQIPWYDAIRYYILVFANRAEILLPLALLIAFVHTVCSLNVHQELVALLVSGFNSKLLMRPFFLIGILSALLIYANEQFVLPHTLKTLRKMEGSTKHKKRNHAPLLAVDHVVLQDGSLLVFQNYNPEEKRFFDVYWVESTNSIYRMKYLTTSSSPMGFFVDHIIRQSNGELLQEKSISKMEFPSLKFSPELLHSTIMEPDILSISELFNQVYRVSSDLDEKESKLLSAFYWKLAIPWLCLLAIIAPAPYCIKHSRQLPVFLIYVCCLFGLIAFYMFMDAAQVIAKRQVLTPALAILTPFLIIFGFFGWRFCTLKY